jgi:hypothetical protein
VRGAGYRGMWCEGILCLRFGLGCDMVRERSGMAEGSVWGAVRRQLAWCVGVKSVVV